MNTETILKKLEEKGFKRIYDHDFYYRESSCCLFEFARHRPCNRPGDDLDPYDEIVTICYIIEEDKYTFSCHDTSKVPGFGVLLDDEELELFDLLIKAAKCLVPTGKKATRKTTFRPLKK